MPRKRKQENESGQGQSRYATHGVYVLPLSATIDRIRYWHRQRCAAMEARKTIDLRLGAHLRTFLGWSLQISPAERKSIADRAKDMIDGADAGEWAEFIAAFVKAREPFDKIESRAVKEMEVLAATLPAWRAFGEQIRGFGRASLAVIVAEAGDLSNYANPGKLWKRMGLAVMGDVRQGGLAKNASKEDWIAHGYNRQRRSRMWNIGDSLIKSNKGELREIYLTRKAYELARNPEMKLIKAHRRAQRYMEKRLLKNLWKAWRANGKELPEQALPAAPIPPKPTGLELYPVAGMSAEHSAKVLASSLPRLPSVLIPVKAGKRRAVVAMKSNDGLPSASSSAKAECSARVASTPTTDMPSTSMPVEAGRKQAKQVAVSVVKMPASHFSAQAERSATRRLPTNKTLPSAPKPAKAGKRQTKTDATSMPQMSAANQSRKCFT